MRKPLLSIVALSLLAFSQLLVAEPLPGVVSSSKILVGSERQATQLTNDEILKTFSNVRDDAEVQNASRTQAVNYWYADGRFVSRWWHANGSGEVVGVWRAKNDLRCVTISSGLAPAEGQERCSAILRFGDKYQSLNPDGSIHGIHVLSTMRE